VSRDPFARGWTPTPRTRTAVYLAVGFALVTAPLWAATAIDVVAGETVTYDAVEVQPEGDGFAFDGSTGLVHIQGVDGIDCYIDVEQSRTCLLEQQLVDGNVTVESVPGGRFTERYVHYDQFYERQQSSRGSRVELGLRPVDASAVLENVSTPAEFASDAAGRAIEQGQVEADPDLRESSAFVRADSAYYLIAPQSQASGGTGSSLPWQWFAVLVGLLALRRGQKHYDRLAREP
jgi:hypothetical protein